MDRPAFAQFAPGYRLGRMATQVIQVQVAHEDRDALQRIITTLVDERLIACGQIAGPVSSTFFWAGGVQDSEEWLGLLKTGAGTVDRLVARIAELHSYEVPEILAITFCGGYAPYLEWVTQRTKPG